MAVRVMLKVSLYKYYKSRKFVIATLADLCFDCRWLNRLDGLMSQVNDKFQTFFASMGYAGEIKLNRGNFENDFANYGVEILVKFRENMPLQKLDPFRQSGNKTCYELVSSL